MKKQTQVGKSKVLGHYRQGDVLIMRIDKIPNKSELEVTNRVTAALGEASGHHHTIQHGAIGYGKDAKGLAQFATVTEEGVSMTHQEHDAIAWKPGNYEFIQQVEHTQEGLKAVRD